MIDDGPCKVQDVAARNAWWKMPRTEVQRFSELFGVVITPSASLFDTLIASIQGILKTDDETTLKYVGRRLVREKVSSAFTDQLLQLDIAIDLVDQNDKEAFKHDIKHAQKQVENLDEFIVELAQHRQSMEVKKKKKMDANMPRLPRVLTQPEAALFCPPEGHIWVSNHRREFWGHLEKSGYRRVWDVYHEDSEEAETACMISVLQKLWVQHNTLNGFARTACPFAGIFPST